MTGKHIERLLWVMASLMVLSAGLGVRREASRASPATMVRLPPLGSKPFGTRERSVDADLRAIEDADLFRRERQPSAVTVRVPESAIPPRPPSPPKPRLVLRGLVGGPPWNAILEGVPGYERNLVVRAGDSIGGLRIRSVRGDGATIRGLDTTWALTLWRTP